MKNIFFPLVAAALATCAPAFASGHRANVRTEVACSAGVYAPPVTQFRLLTVPAVQTRAYAAQRVAATCPNVTAAKVRAAQAEAEDDPLPPGVLPANPSLADVIDAIEAEYPNLIPQLNGLTGGYSVGGNTLVTRGYNGQFFRSRAFAGRGFRAFTGRGVGRGFRGRGVGRGVPGRGIGRGARGSRGRGVARGNRGRGQGVGANRGNRGRGVARGGRGRGRR